MIKPKKLFITDTSMQITVTCTNAIMQFTNIKNCCQILFMNIKDYS